MQTIVRLGLVSAVLCFLIWSPLPRVSADGPLIEEFEYEVNHELMANCGDFQIIADGKGRNRITTFFNREGNQHVEVFAEDAVWKTLNVTDYVDEIRFVRRWATGLPVSRQQQTGHKPGRQSID